MQGKALYLPPPGESMKGILSPMEEMQVNAFLALSVTGGPVSARSKLDAILKQMPVDELMFTNDIYDEEKRLKALELLITLQSQ